MSTVIKQESKPICPILFVSRFLRKTPVFLPFCIEYSDEKISVRKGRIHLFLSSFSVPFLFTVQTLVLLLFWHYCFKHPAWKKSHLHTVLLFLAPFLLGCIMLWLDIHLLYVDTLRRWHNLFCFFCLLTVLILLPQWYKLMWRSLTTLSIPEYSDTARLFFIALFSFIMMLAVIFFFALYYLWMDYLSGFTQGLRSAACNYQPILLDFASAFHFSFCCYFSLGYGIYAPYGNWFYFLIFLECLIAFINNGIIICYAFHLLFKKE